MGPQPFGVPWVTFDGVWIDEEGKVLEISDEYVKFDDGTESNDLKTDRNNLTFSINGEVYKGHLLENKSCLEINGHVWKKVGLYDGLWIAKDGSEFEIRGSKVHSRELSNASSTTSEQVSDNSISFSGYSVVTTDRPFNNKLSLKSEDPNESNNMLDGRFSQNLQSIVFSNGMIWKKFENEDINSKAEMMKSINEEEVQLSQMLQMYDIGDMVKTVYQDPEMKSSWIYARIKNIHYDGTCDLQLIEGFTYEHDVALTMGVPLDTLLKSTNESVGGALNESSEFAGGRNNSKSISSFEEFNEPSIVTE